MSMREPASEREREKGRDGAGKHNRGDNKSRLIIVRVKEGISVHSKRPATSKCV